MPITDEKELKRYLSSEAYKNEIRPLKLDWAQDAGRLLQMIIHGEIGSRFPSPNRTHERPEKKSTIRTGLTMPVLCGHSVSTRTP